MKFRICCVFLCFIFLFPLQPVIADNTISITFSVYENVNKRYILSAKNLELPAGSSVLAALDASGISYNESGGYVSAIGGFTEKQYGKESGWMFEVNGVKINTSCKNVKLNSGDTVKWIYTVSFNGNAGASESPSSAGKAASPGKSQKNGNSSPSKASSVSRGSASNSGNTPEKTAQANSEKTSSTQTASGISQNTEQNAVSSSAGNASKSKAEGSSQSPAENQSKSIAASESLKQTGERLESNQKVIRQTAGFIQQNPGGFTPFALKFAGYDVKNYKQALLNEIEKSKGKFTVTTDCVRLIINAAAVGIDLHNAGGYDLISILKQGDPPKQGLNGPIFALYVYSSVREADSALTDEERQMLDVLLSAQKPDGSFSLAAESESNTDITAMAVTVLSRYRSDKRIENCLNKAVGWLSLNQNPDGTFSSLGEVNCESTAQVVIALVSGGIDINDERFVKNQINPLTALLSFKSEDGFSHMAGSETDVMASEQALIALSSYALNAYPYDLQFESVKDKNRTPVVLFAVVGSVLILGILAGGFLFCRKRVSLRKLKESSADDKSVNDTEGLNELLKKDKETS